MAKNELLNSTLYRDLIISADGKTTAILLNLKVNETLEIMIEQRDALRLKRLSGSLSDSEFKELNTISKEIKNFRKQERDKNANMVATIRAVLDQYKNKAGIFLGGVPMITVDMIDFIQKDIQIFGAAILLFLIVALLIIFKNPRNVYINIFLIAINLTYFSH